MKRKIRNERKKRVTLQQKQKKKWKTLTYNGLVSVYFVRINLKLTKNLYRLVSESLIISKFPRYLYFFCNLFFTIQKNKPHLFLFCFQHFQCTLWLHCTTLQAQLSAYYFLFLWKRSTKPMFQLDDVQN